MTSMTALGRDTFSSLRNPNYRRYFSGQAISLSGTWMQQVAQSWLILQLTGSATQVGLVVALQTLPVLLLGSYAGVVADRVDKRKFMIMLQSMMGLIALVLGVLTVTHAVQLWMIYLLAVLLGLNNSFENPVRQSFVLEMVGPEDLRNAVTLNSVMVNVARVIGPAVAGLIIAVGGTGFCFLLNSASFVAVVYSLVTLDVSRLQPTKPAGRHEGQLREGLAYVRATPVLSSILIMMAVVGCLAYEFQVVLPVVARQTFHGGSEVYGFMTSAMGAGAVVGGLYLAARGRTGVASVARSSLLFGIAFLAAGFAPNLAVELVVLPFLGAASISAMSKANSTLQLGSIPAMRGRVMSLWAIAFMGSTPIGGPIAGLITEQWGGRAGLFLGAGACILAAGYGAVTVRRTRRSELAATPVVADEEIVAV
jgi:MFS family permease